MGQFVFFYNKQPVSQLTLLVFITMKSSMYARQYLVVLARNCLASTLDYIVTQMKKIPVKRAINPIIA